MGRGRAKAKQTKVARDLKYRSIDTDFSSLERELRGGSFVGESTEDEIPDAYADLVEGAGLAEGYEDDDEYERRSS